MSIKRFNYALDSVWYANEAKYKSDYAKSIVFIHKSNGDGVAIYAHGSYFPTDVSLNNFNELVDSVLSEGANITITPTKDAQGKITDIKIGAVSLSSLKGLADTDKTKLVEAQAVVDAFSDVNSELIYDPTTANADSYTFQQEFTNLKGEKISPKKPTVKITAGDNVTLDANANDGLIISATDTTYTISATSTETNKVNLNLSDNSEIPVIDKVTFTGSGDATVSVSGTANNEVITINTTPYIGKEAISVDSSLVENKTSKEVKLVIDSTDKFLSQSTSGLKANIEVAYDSTTNYIYLKGKTSEGEVLTTTGFDASAFVKDSFLDSAEFVTLTDGEVEGKTAGEYLKLVFKTVDTDTNPETVNSTQTVYLPVGDLVKTGSMDFKGDTTKEFTFDATAGKYVDGTNLATALNKLDADLDATKGDGTDTNEVAVVTGITQTNGLITSVDSAVVVNKTYVDNATKTGTIEWGDLKDPDNTYHLGAVVREGNEGLATVDNVANIINNIDSHVTAAIYQPGGYVPQPLAEGEIAVVAGVTQHNGKITEVDSVAVVTKTYVDNAAAAATTTVVESTDTESQKYLDITSSTETDGSTKYTVKVSGIDNAISTAIGNLDSNVGTVGSNTGAAIADGALIDTNQMFSKIVIEDGKLVPTKSITSFVDRAKLEGYGKTGITTTAVVENYLGLTDSDSIVEAFAKANAAWDWGIIE